MGAVSSVTDDRLVDLLRAADQAALPPATSVGLAVRVRRIDRNRRRTRRTLVFAGVALLATVGWVAKSGAPRRDVVVKKTDVKALTEVERLKNEIATLRIEADSQRRLAKELCAIRDRLEGEDDAERAQAELSVVQELDVQVERAAMTLLLRADRARNAGEQLIAAAAYERVAKLFPDTASAASARQRLRD
jgi:hypothetical protein